MGTTYKVTIATSDCWSFARKLDVPKSTSKLGRRCMLPLWVRNGTRMLLEMPLPHTRSFDSFWIWHAVFVLNVHERLRET